MLYKRKEKKMIQGECDELQLLSCLALKIWWEAVTTVNALLSNSLVSLDFDRDLNQVERVIDKIFVSIHCRRPRSLNAVVYYNYYSYYSEFKGGVVVYTANMHVAFRDPTSNASVYNRSGALCYCTYCSCLASECCGPYFGEGM